MVARSRSILQEFPGLIAEGCKLIAESKAWEEIKVRGNGSCLIVLSLPTQSMCCSSEACSAASSTIFCFVTTIPFIKFFLVKYYLFTKYFSLMKYYFLTKYYSMMK